jgi:hypothetical protein
MSISRYLHHHLLFYLKMAIKNQSVHHHLSSLKHLTSFRLFLKSPAPPGLTLHSRISPPSPPTSRSRSHSYSSLTRKRTPDLSPSRLRVPKPDDVPKIQKLTRELWDLRRQVTAGVARETSILNELRDLNSPPIPESSTRLKSNDELSDCLVFVE